jgi:deaminated glutathione amidase
MDRASSPADRSGRVSRGIRGLYVGAVMKVAVAQFSAGMDKAANLARIEGLAERAATAGAQLAVFPEAAMYDFGSSTDDLRSPAESLDGPFVGSLIRLSARLHLAVVVGMFEAIPGDHRVHNTAVIVDPRRGLVAAYRKRHLFDAFGDSESERIRPGGEDPPLLELHGFKVAVAVCYDLRFPGFIERIADRGAELLLVPSAWVAGPLKEEHWSVLLRARAIENTIYLAAAGQTGTSYCGRSSIVDPLGVVMAALGVAEGYVTAEVSEDRLREVRARLPVLAQRRSEAEASAQG